MTKISFITFGCSMNFSDSELMMGLLDKEGYELIPEPDDADLIIVNSCTVKNLAETKFWRTLKQLKEKNKKVIVTGCIAQAEQKYVDNELKNYSIIGTKQINRICHVVEQTIEGNIVHLLDTKNNPRLNLPKIRKNNIIGIVPISEGCLGNCTYCKTKLARGSLISFSPEEILKQINSDLEDGCKEIWLTSQDCGAYGKDINTNICELLKKILEIKKEFYIRLGMTNPNFAFEFLDELLEIFHTNYKNIKDSDKSAKLFMFLHIPIQAGNDQVLKNMNRKYTVEQFKTVIARFREKIPLFTFATDMICGFPGETNKQFQDSLELMQKTKPDVINISRFWSRPGTPAEKLPNQIHGRETNKRSREMREIFLKISFERNKMWEQEINNIPSEIIIDEKGTKKGEKSWIGRNRSYKPIVTKNKHKLGNKIKIKAVKTHKFYLEHLNTA